jgi:predicted aspartyl protease
MPEENMENATMGRVLVEAVVENLQDIWDERRGMLPAEKVRRVIIADALVDTGATTLALPTRHIHELGLKKAYEKPAVSSSGRTKVNVYDVARLNIQGRQCAVEVIELPDEVPTLIGQIPLEMMDFVVDLQARRLIGNPAHGGEQVIEVL